MTVRESGQRSFADALVFRRAGINERLDHIRSVDAEASLPAGQPATVERFVIQGAAPGVSGSWPA